MRRRRKVSAHEQFLAKRTQLGKNTRRYKTEKVYTVAVRLILDQGVPLAAPETVLAVATTLIQRGYITNWTVQGIIRRTDPVHASIREAQLAEEMVGT